MATRTKKAPVMSRNAQAAVAKAAGKPLPPVGKAAPIVPATPAKFVGPTPLEQPARAVGARSVVVLAPTKPNIHLPAPEAAKAGVTMHKEQVKAAVKADKDALLAKLMAGETLNAGQLSAIPATMLDTYFKANKGKFVGYSSMNAEQKREYILTGERPEVEKKAPGTGTMGWHQDKLRNGLEKGYPAEVTALSKDMFKGSVSTLKAAQVKALYVAALEKGLIAK